MATKDGFQPDRSPLFLSEHAENTGQLDIGRALNRAAISSRILKTSISALTATAIAIAVLSMADPVELLENVTALWADKSAVQPAADPSTPTTQSVASTQDLPPASDAPARDEIAAAVEPADRGQAQAGQSQPEAGQSQAEIGQPLTEALFQQFQAWAAEEDARPKAEPARPAQAARTGCAGCPGPGPAHEEAPTGPVRTKCARRDPAPSKSSSKGPRRAKCAGTDRPGTRSPGTGAGCAKYPDTLAPAGPRFALMQRRRNCASPRAAVSKMLADCEVLYTPVFLARAKMTEASCFVGGIRCSRPSNGTPDITRANG